MQECNSLFHWQQNCLISQLCVKTLLLHKDYTAAVNLCIVSSLSKDTYICIDIYFYICVYICIIINFPLPFRSNLSGCWSCSSCWILVLDHRMLKFWSQMLITMQKKRVSLLCLISMANSLCSSSNTKHTSAHMYILPLYKTVLCQRMT